jgi:hypothetical protein
MREPVARDPAAQVVHVMDADIRGEPADYRGKVVVRTAVQGGIVPVPRLVFFPCRMLELVLHKEEPHADRRCDQHDRYMHKQERLKADEPDRKAGEERNPQIGADDTEPRLPAAARPGVGAGR